MSAFYREVDAFADELVVVELSSGRRRVVLIQEHLTQMYSPEQAELLAKAILDAAKMAREAQQ